MPVPDHKDEERDVVKGTPFNVTSITSSDSSSFANIDLTQELLDQEGTRKIVGKK